MEIPGLVNNNIALMTMAPGGFFVFGLLIAFMNKFAQHKPRKKDLGCEGCPQAESCGKLSCTEKTKEAAVND